MEICYKQNCITFGHEWLFGLVGAIGALVVVYFLFFNNRTKIKLSVNNSVLNLPYPLGFHDTLSLEIINKSSFPIFINQIWLDNRKKNKGVSNMCITARNLPLKIESRDSSRITFSTAEIENIVNNNLMYIKVKSGTGIIKHIKISESQLSTLNISFHRYSDWIKEHL